MWIDLAGVVTCQRLQIPGLGPGRCQVVFDALADALQVLLQAGIVEVVAGACRGCVRSGLNGQVFSDRQLPDDGS
ncbi:hypothetical protein DFO60_2929 [Ectopseudomonas oleovorans]|uniref:Uncharacterized protein n=1 Tax=Ectopseudomonas oleovorans TaxID=301 RepID=A0A3D9EI96_ECTOL|nr:hypothetical protein DFO60_2929 [Pseudomonas oleovorans]